MRTLIIYVLFLLVNVTPLIANDSSLVFSLSDFLSQVMKYHPVAKQAELLTEQGRQQLRVSRGLFDPQFKMVYDNKTYDDKLYWDKTLASFSVPLWIGELKTSYQNNGGQYLNPENNTPQQYGLNMIGLSVPIGQGLIIDERRAQLRSAQLMQQMMEADKVKLINDLLLRCTRDYWDWMFYYQKWRLNQIGYSLSLERYENVVERVLSGDLAEIDRKLYSQKLLPKINTEFYILSKGVLPTPGQWSSTSISSNAKLGLSFSYPLFIREERG